MQELEGCRKLHVGSVRAKQKCCKPLQCNAMQTTMKSNAIHTPWHFHWKLSHPLPFELTGLQVLTLHEIYSGPFRTGILVMVFAMFGFLRAHCFVEAAILLQGGRNSLEMFYSLTILIWRRFMSCFVCLICTVPIVSSLKVQSSNRNYRS